MNFLYRTCLWPLMLVTLAACDARQADRPGMGATVDAAPQIVKVGTEGSYYPFSYQDDNGRLTGYDIEVLREIERREPSLRFELIAAPWETLFPGLDSDRFQLLANQLVSTPERVARYYLTDVGYFTCVSQLIVRGDDRATQGFSDLHGKKIGQGVGNNHTRIVEDWHAANGNALNIVYYEGDDTNILRDIDSGRVAATLNDPIMATGKARRFGLNIKPIGARLAAQPTRFIVKKNEAGLRLKNKIDAVLATMKADGTLRNMSLAQFGEDYSQ